MKEQLLSWGRWPRRPQEGLPLHWLPRRLPEGPLGQWLPRGLGRSYGDCCLHSDGRLLLTASMDHILSFERQTGVLRAEAGLSLDALLQVCLPSGWFPAVTPGTRFVTLGGAVANDVHGKNHHRAGSFGHHVRRIGLLRREGLLVLGPEDALFRATIGGLGLTGLILWVELQLQAVKGPWFDAEAIRFGSLDEFLDREEEINRHYAYTAAWVDGFSAEGRGVCFCGNHSQDRDAAALPRPRMGVPAEAPDWLLNPLGQRLFNELYYRKPAGRSRVHAFSFLYPLDALNGWNRLYGRRGFQQWQCVVPRAAGRGVLKEVLKRTRSAGEASYLALLKSFGERSSPGMLGFCRPGWTLALDFPMRGPSTSRMLRELSGIVMQAGGALYPAKDAQMSDSDFRAGTPGLQEFLPHRETAFQSDFWQRVAGDERRE